MVNKHVFTIRPCLVAIVIVAVMLVMPVGAQSSAVVLAPGLEIVLPDSLAVHTWAASDAGSDATLVGEIDSSPSYFMAAVRVEEVERNHILWRRLETELSKHSDSGTYQVTTRGSFATQTGEGVWYRAYQYERGDQTQRQIYYLLSGERSSYWLTVTLVEGVGIDLVLPVVRALVRRISITDRRVGPDPL